MNALTRFFRSLAEFLTRKPPAMHDTSNLTILRGDGSWPWSAHIDGDDIVVLGVGATCFGGGNDPMDSGETASGISTKRNPRIVACALPMAYKGRDAATRKALGGSPIPMMPWFPQVVVTINGKSLQMQCIDLGPGKRTGDAIDLTVAAARHFKPSATANNFQATCDYRILGAAKYAKGGTHA